MNGTNIHILIKIISYRDTPEDNIIYEIYPDWKGISYSFSAHSISKLFNEITTLIEEYKRTGEGE